MIKLKKNKEETSNKKIGGNLGLPDNPIPAKWDQDKFIFLNDVEKNEVKSIEKNIEIFLNKPKLIWLTRDLGQPPYKEKRKKAQSSMSNNPMSNNEIKKKINFKKIYIKKMSEP